MRHYLKIAILLLTALLSCHQAEAQQALIRNFTTTDYNGGTQNWCIDITPANRVLFANNSGLKTYNSVRWETLTLSNYSQTRTVMYDSIDHRTYVGGSNEFGYFQPDKESQLNRYHSLSRYLPEKLREFHEVWNILKWKDIVVFQTRQHLFFLHPNRRMTYMETPFLIECTAIIGTRLYVASKQGVYTVGNGRLTQIPGTEALRGIALRTILPYEGNMIFATAVNGLYLYDGNTTRKMELDITPFIEKNQLFCAAIHGDMLAVGTIRDGLVMRNMKTGQTQYANIDTGLQNNTVLSLRFDQTGNIWLGLDQGIAYVMNNSSVQYLFGNLSPIGTGYASATDGSLLYLGTNQGLFSLPYTITNGPTPPTPQLVGALTGQVWSLTHIDGTLFCGCNAGTYLIRGQQAERIAGVEGTWRLIPLKQHPGMILGCDYQGLFLLRKGSNNRYEFAWRIDNFKKSSSSFLEDEDGTIWMSHWQHGIFHLKLSEDLRHIRKQELYNSKNGLLVDDNNQICRIQGHIYVSTVDGFYQLNHQTGRLEHADDINHIFQNYGQALRVIESPTGDLWAYKQGYLAVAHPQQDGTYIASPISNMELVNGLQMVFGHPSFIGQTTLMNCERGFVQINSHASPIPPQGRKILVYEIQSTNGKDSVLHQQVTPRRQEQVYQFHHAFNSLHIYFVLPEYATGNETEYSCMMEGYDKAWSPYRTENNKEYTRLPKGKYTFHVRANNLLNGMSYSTKIHIEILPAWYETWWAYLLYLMAACALGWATFHIAKKRERAMVEKAKREEAIKRERQQALYEIEQQKKENELTRLRADQLEYEMKANASKLADSTINLMRKNDMLLSLDEQMSELAESVRHEDPKADITRRIRSIRHHIQGNIKEDDNWEKFEENFNLVYDNFMRKLTAKYPDLKLSDRKLVAYLRMGLSSKEMASLLNTTTRSIETARYRLRKKLQIESGDNLTEFIQSLDTETKTEQEKSTD